MFSLLGRLYGKVANTRNRLYESGVFESFDLGARTISIGNITTGGTGKTPFVALVARMLSERGESVCVLTRGYGRRDENKRVLVSDGERVLADWREAGDEPVELAAKLLGKAIVIADADRVGAAEWARRRFGITAFVLDDGFQHRKVRRDLDIVCVDATQPLTDGSMVPSGHLREPVHNLRRADVIVITRSDLVADVSDLKKQIESIAPAAAVFTAENHITGVISLGDDSRFDANVPVLGFCGLGNADNFFTGLARNGINVVHTMPFADHHAYSQKDIDMIGQEALARHARALVTTGKDAVKLTKYAITLPCFVAQIDVRVDRPDDLARLI